MNQNLVKTITSVALLFSATQVDAAITGWNTIGNSGVQVGTDGAVTPPAGYGSVNWISTYLGVNGNNGGYGGTDGSTVSSNPFAVTASGQTLSFQFDFVTSDGTTTFPDYAWANLYNASTDALVATLFTATTNPNGSAVPGIGAGLPAISATINPATVTITTGAGSTDWSPLGPSSGACYGGYGAGCGNTGWVSATYNISDIGNYYLDFGVANAGDTALDTGLAFVGTSIAGKPIGENPNNVPEPSELGIFALGLLMLGFLRRRKSS